MGAPVQKLTPDEARAAAGQIDGGIDESDAAGQAIVRITGDLSQSGMVGQGGTAMAAKAQELYSRLQKHNQIAREKSAGIRNYASQVEAHEASSAARANAI